MHRRFAEYFADPHTLEPLTLEIERADGDIVETGVLRCSTSSYPIVRGIPRFVPFELDNYAESFAWQWHRWPRLQFDEENIGKPMEGYTTRMWERVTGIQGAPFSTDDVILDIGCGPGRFTDVARRKGASVIALDYSAAVEVAQKNFINDPDVCVVQADALALPLRSASISNAFSIGVLHHTPDPAAAVHQVRRVLRNGGWFALSVYAKGGYYNFPSVRAWRGLFGTLSRVFGHYPALGYSYLSVAAHRILRPVPVLGQAIRAPLPSIYLPDFQWSLLDTFDSITPSYQSGHETYEVFSWLESAGFEDVVPGDWGPTTFRGYVR